MHAHDRRDCHVSVTFSSAAWSATTTCTTHQSPKAYAEISLKVWGRGSRSQRTGRLVAVKKQRCGFSAGLSVRPQDRLVRLLRPPGETPGHNEHVLEPSWISDGVLGVRRFLV